MFGPQPPPPAFGGQTANQVRQPMSQNSMQMPAQGMGPVQNPMMMGMQGMQQPMPQTMQQPGAPGVDPQMLAKLRALLMQQQQIPGHGNNLRQLLGL